jgi:hypothetical protein
MAARLHPPLGPLGPMGAQEGRWRLSRVPADPNSPPEVRWILNELLMMDADPSVRVGPKPTLQAI